MRYNKAISSLVCVLVLLACTPVVLGQPVYSFTVESYARHAWVGGSNGFKLPPEQQELDPITITTYLQDYCLPGGSAQETPASYVELVEGTKYDIKVPISANTMWMGNDWKVLFEYWEVVDVNGTSELDWPDGYLEKYVYVDYPSPGNRTTKIFPVAKGLPATAAEAQGYPETWVGDGENPEWDDPVDVDNSDNDYAYTNTSGAVEIYSDFIGGWEMPASLPLMDVIDRVQVGVELKGDGDDSVRMHISVDGGATWGPKHDITAPASETMIWVDVTDDLRGPTRSWDRTMIEGLKVRLRARKGGATMNTIYVDWLPLLVDFTDIKTRTDRPEEYLQRAPKELLDDGTGIREPYITYTVNNTIGGGNKTLMAIYQLAWGPECEHMYFRAILSPDACVEGFENDEVDVITDLTRTADIDALEGHDAIITGTPGFHMCYLGSNLRLPWMGPQDGTGHGQALRQAMAQLLPKDTLISTLFKYISVRLDTFVPPSWEEWYNPDVTVWDYNPAGAYNTLLAGGWTYNSGLGTWEHTGAGVVAGGADNSIEVLSPLNITAPTSFTIVGRYVQELNNLKNPATGDPTPLKAHRAAIDYYTIVMRAFLYRTFEQYFHCMSDLSADSIYYSFHSNWDIPWGDNTPGLHNPAVDALLEMVEFGTDHYAKVQAHKDAQHLISTMLPVIPIYSRNYFNAHQNSSYGVVISPGFGIDNFWTFTSIDCPRESYIVTIPHGFQVLGTNVIWALNEEVESHNPAEARTDYARAVLETMYDGLIGTNPYTLLDMPWLAEAWNIVWVDGPMTTPHGVEVTDGMYVEFILDDRVVEGKVRWHDGEVFNADDIMWSWQYAWDNSLTNHYAFHERLVDIDNPSPDRVVVYWDRQSQWLPYDAADTAALYAPQVWGYIDTDFDGQTYTGHGDVEGDLSIRTYQPEDHLRSDLGAYPAQAAFPWLTQAIGTGPFVLYSATEDGYHTDMVAFDLRTHTTVVPSVHYWKSKAEITARKIEMFYHLGDVSLDGSIDIFDISRMAIRLFQSGPTYPTGDYRGFIQEDVKEDGVINIVDLATAGKNFGKMKEY